MPLDLQIEDSNNSWSVGCTNDSCPCDCYLFETQNYERTCTHVKRQWWMSLYKKSLEGNFPHHSASGQGTLKLPMSFSKFSLCPPRGAASQGWFLRARFVWQVVTIFSVRTWLTFCGGIYNMNSTLKCIYTNNPWNSGLWFFDIHLGPDRLIHTNRNNILVTYRWALLDDTTTTTTTTTTTKKKTVYKELGFRLKDNTCSEPQITSVMLPNPCLPWFHLSRAKARRDGSGQGAGGVQERSGHNMGQQAIPKTTKTMNLENQNHSGLFGIK